MNLKEPKRKWGDLDVRGKALLAKERLLDPECTQLEFARKHNVETSVLKKIENKINFNEDTAVGELMWRIMVKDNELLDLATDINLKYVKQIWDKKVVKDKEVDMLDKITNSAIKRAALIKTLSWESEDSEKEESVKISINL